MEYKKNIPLVVCQDTERILKQIRKICLANSDIVKYFEDSTSLIRVIDLDDKSSFYFQIHSVKLHNNKTIFTFEYKPQSVSNINPGEQAFDYDNTIRYFNLWIQFIKSYNAISISEEDKINEFYENEFYSAFDIIDEDADINPFDLEKQLVISKLIDSTINSLHANDISNKDEIIVDLIDLKKNQQNYTKRIAIRKLSKIFTKIRKRSIDLLKFVLKEFIKESIKLGIHTGFEYFLKMLN
jgi:hypothetical protein